MHARRSRGLVALSVILATGLGLAACTTSGAPEKDPDPVPTQVIESIKEEPVTYQLDEIATRVSDELDTEVGITVFDAEGVQQAGTLLSGAAWSSIKVPLALAAIRNDEETIPLLQAAIEFSDNDAAELLWESLGDDRTAREKVEEVLQEAGDEITVVDGDHFDENSRGFGDTEWLPAAQAKFASQLRCMEGSEPLLESMGTITEEQRYGLGQVTGAIYKGGWGPDENTGDYLVRQFGLLPVEAGEVGVAILVKPEDGTYETGQLALTRLAEALAKALVDAAPTAC
ncbi:hypothetical protein [Corynebacterium sp. A21]|uniref:hypothetical protein n=1 Tax=Corynebacterium sp. A21 TaxID=3457318 RepID=UPI003FD2E47E